VVLAQPVAQGGLRRAPVDPLARQQIPDPARLGASLAEFVGHPAYGTAQLRQDLDRFTFLLGADAGRSLFGPHEAG
jgi:hypothetical protein